MPTARSTSPRLTWSATWGRMRTAIRLPIITRSPPRPARSSISRSCRRYSTGPRGLRHVFDGLRLERQRHCFQRRLLPGHRLDGPRPDAPGDRHLLRDGDVVAQNGLLERTALRGLRAVHVHLRHRRASPAGLDPQATRCTPAPATTRSSPASGMTPSSPIFPWTLSSTALAT